MIPENFTQKSYPTQTFDNKKPPPQKRKRALSIIEYKPAAQMGEMTIGMIPVEVWMHIFDYLGDPWKNPACALCCKTWRYYVDIHCKLLNEVHNFLPWDESKLHEPSERMIYLVNKTFCNVLLNNLLIFEDFYDTGSYTENILKTKSYEFEKRVNKFHRNCELIASDKDFLKIGHIIKTTISLISGWNKSKNITQSINKLIAKIETVANDPNQHYKILKNHLLSLIKGATLSIEFNKQSSSLRSLIDVERLKEIKAADKTSAQWASYIKLIQVPMDIHLLLAARAHCKDGKIEEATEYWQRFFANKDVRICSLIDLIYEIHEALPFFIQTNKSKELTWLCLAALDFRIDVSDEEMYYDRFVLIIETLGTRKHWDEAADLLAKLLKMCPLNDWKTRNFQKLLKTAYDSCYQAERFTDAEDYRQWLT